MGNRPLSVVIAALGLVALPARLDAGDLVGRAKDTSGGGLVGARIVVMTPQRAVVATVTTDQTGSFAVIGLPDGQYIVIARYPSLAETQTTVTLAGATPTTIDLTLELASLGADVTVTASPGGLEWLGKAAQPVNVISADDLLARAKTVVAQAVEGETGVSLQRTSPGMAGVFVRGLTGNKVNVFVDGVRYSNGAQRGGVNTFLDLIDPAALEGIEVLRGTASAQYGSDALGGSVQFLSRVPPLSTDGTAKVSGRVIVGAETAHQGGMGTVSLAYSRSRVGVFGTYAGRKTGDYRPGGGHDTHAAVTRFFGVPSRALYGERMPDTGFRQLSGQARLNWVPRSDTAVVVNYLSTRQDGANRWDQMLGGDGNLVAALDDLELDLAYIRVEKSKAGWFDHASFTYSFNTQREERINQGGNGNPTASIAHEPERTTVHGLQASATRKLPSRQTLLVGADLYWEGLTSVATNVTPVTGAITPRRPRVPDGARYRQGGVFGQLTVEPTDRLTVTGAVRVGYNGYRARLADAPVVNGRPLWPDDSLETRSATFRLGAAWAVASEWTVAASVSRGYRAPHMTDLGTLGLTGSGFELAAPDVEGRAAFVGTAADSTAVSSGRGVTQVQPETSLNVDAALRYRTPALRLSVGGFANRLDGNIQKVAVILPPGAVGTTIGGEPITSQTPGGAVFVALTTVPVLIRANFDDARIWGLEWTGDVRATGDITIGSTYTYTRATDRATGLPPNIEGGTPAPGGTLWVRYLKSGGRWWVQPYLTFAADQPRLSSLDLGDRRTGASRSRANIQNFFRNGARAHGWINPGADGTFGTADDVLILTGETLAQIQDRVLGPGVSSAPLFTKVAGYTIAGVRFGLRMGPHSVLVDVENIGDASWRGISWGMDGPGRGVAIRYLLQF